MYLKKAELIWIVGRHMRLGPINNKGRGGFTARRNVTGVSAQALKEFMDWFIRQGCNQGGLGICTLIKMPNLSGLERPPLSRNSVQTPTLTHTR